MRIAQVEDITVLDINNLAKYYIVADKLDDPLVECIENSDYINKVVDDYKQVFQYKIRNKDNKFKLIVGLDKEMQLVFFVSLILTEDSGESVCLVYTLYSKPGVMNKLVPSILWYIDQFMLTQSCYKMLFHTDIKNTKALTKMGKKYSWKPTRTVFERSIER